MTLQNSSTIPLRAMHPGRTSNLNFRHQNNNTKLSLRIRISATLARLRRFLGQKSTHPNGTNTRPTTHIRHFSLHGNRVMRLNIFTNTTLRTNIINRSRRTIPTRLSVRLSTITTLPSNEPRDKSNIFQNGKTITTIMNSGKHRTTRHQRRNIILKRTRRVNYNNTTHRNSTYRRDQRRRTTTTTNKLVVQQRIQLKPTLRPRMRRARSNTLNRDSPTIRRGTRRKRLRRLRYTKRRRRNTNTFRPYRHHSTMRRNDNRHGRRTNTRRRTSIPPNRHDRSFTRPLLRATTTLFCNKTGQFTFRRRRKRRRDGRSNRRRGNRGTYPVRHRGTQLYPSSTRSVFKRNRLNSMTNNSMRIHRQSRRRAMRRSKPILQIRRITSIHRKNPRRNKRAKELPPTNPIRPIRRSKGFVRIPRHRRGNSRRGTTRGTKNHGSLIYVNIHRMIRQQGTRHRTPSTPRNKRRRGLNRRLVRCSNNSRNDFNPPSRNLYFLPGHPMDNVYLPRNTIKATRWSLASIRESIFSRHCVFVDDVPRGATGRGSSSQPFHPGFRTVFLTSFRQDKVVVRWRGRRRRRGKVRFRCRVEPNHCQRFGNQRCRILNVTRRDRARRRLIICHALCKSRSL